MSVHHFEGRHRRGTPGWTVDVPHQQFGGGAICWVPPPSAFFTVIVLMVVGVIDIDVIVVGVNVLAGVSWWWW
jgi:hypothetical protein